MNSIAARILNGKLPQAMRPETNAKDAAGIFSKANEGLAPFLLVPKVKRAKAQHE